MENANKTTMSLRGGAAKKDEQLYRMVFEKSTAPTLLLEEDYTISRINERISELLGYNKEEVEGKFKWMMFVAESDRSRMMHYHRLRRQDPSSVPGEYECRLIDRYGQVYDVLLKLDMVLGTTTSIATFVNVTVEREIVKTLRQREAEFRAIVEHFSGFLYTCRKDYHLVYVNGPLRKNRAIRNDNGLCHEVIYGRKKPCPWCENEQVFSGETVETERFDSEENKWYSVITTPVAREGGAITQRQTVLADITERKQMEEQMRSRASRLMEENLRLKTAMKDRYRFHGIIGKTLAMQTVYDHIIQAAASSAPVVILGESGTGKELVAKAIHTLSLRSARAFVAVNCGTIPENLMESEFFGYNKGAFTGATRDKAGLLEQAKGGTLFLDEVGEIPLALQVKLLRSLEGGGFRRLGGEEVLVPDIRIIAATHRDMEAMVERGDMRRDFFYRLHVIPVYLPPLRERKADISLLVEHFLSDMGEEAGVRELDAHTMDAFTRYSWPGNVRELQNALQRYVTLGLLDLPLPEERKRQGGGVGQEEDLPLKKRLLLYERELILEVLQDCKGHRGRTAERLGIDRRTLERKMERFGLREEI